MNEHRTRLLQQVEVAEQRRGVVDAVPNLPQLQLVHRRDAQAQRHHVATLADALP